MHEFDNNFSGGDWHEDDDFISFFFLFLNLNFTFGNMLNIECSKM